jgi:hypothetical protein
MGSQRPPITILSDMATMVNGLSNSTIPAPEAFVGPFWTCNGSERGYERFVDVVVNLKKQLIVWTKHAVD